MENTSEKTIEIQYSFDIDNGIKKDFNISLNEKTLDLIQETPDAPPPWTELSCSKCEHCPLDEAEHKHCPVALSLVKIIDFFKNLISIEKCHITVTTEQRVYKKYTDIQKPIASLIGIYMVTSGCPIMAKLRPMTRFHLPFSSLDETSYRSISTYLFAQYFLYKQGKKPDWDLEHIQKLYENISKLNQFFCKRLREINIADSALNAVVNLDCFAQSMTFSVEMFNEDLLDKEGNLYNSFKSYLE